MAVESLKAATNLAKQGIDVELVDLRTIKPLDENLILKSVKKTGRMVIADGGWKNFGVSAEISALVSEKVFKYLRASIKRVSLPDTPAPASRTLESSYYQRSEDIVRAVKEVIKEN
jgi:pyruvate/2-oxoglutarate/acetoin dehydrogenase E1 component